VLNYFFLINFLQLFINIALGGHYGVSGILRKENGRGQNKKYEDGYFFHFIRKKLNGN
jgi:hypothetical protein